MKIFNKLLIIFSSISLISLPIILTSCSSSNNLRKYDGTYETFIKIADDISHNDFKSNFNIKLNDVKSTDIKWKNSNFYSELTMQIGIIEKGRLEIFTGDFRDKAIRFTFALSDSKKNYLYDAYNKGKSFYLWGFK